MTARNRIMGAGSKTPAVSVLRRRRSGFVVREEAQEGEVITVRDMEDFSINLLRGCPATVNHFRSVKYLHVSDLLGKCIRKIALSEKFAAHMPSSHIQESMAITFAQGVAIHDFVKAKFVAGHPDKAFGTWSCLCGETETGLMIAKDIPEETCRNCNTKPSRYNELVLRDEEFMITGSPDVTLYMDEYGFYYPIEIKSINGEDWKTIARPIPSHVLQVTFYWYLLRKLGYTVPASISILYVNKGFAFRSPYKEFIIHPEDELARLDDYLEDAAELKAFRSGGEVPPRKMCSNIKCADAKACHVAILCFQHD